MSQAVSSIEDIDLDISVASIALRAARAAYDRCPSAENGRRVADAAAGVDRLLDARLGRPADPPGQAAPTGCPP